MFWALADSAAAACRWVLNLTYNRHGRKLRQAGRLLLRRVGVSECTLWPPLGAVFCLQQPSLLSIPSTWLLHRLCCCCCRRRLIGTVVLSSPVKKTEKKVCVRGEGLERRREGEGQREKSFRGSLHCIPAAVLELGVLL